MPKVLNKRVGLSDDCVYVGRPTRWGNKFLIGKDGDRAGVIQKFAESLTEADYIDIKTKLRGKDLVCWCAPLLCHADVLLEIAND